MAVPGPPSCPRNDNAAKGRLVPDPSTAKRTNIYASMVRGRGTNRPQLGQENAFFGGEVADSEGFEPSRRFPAYTLSRRAPSTTRPTVRPGLILRLWQCVQGAFWANRCFPGAVIAARGRAGLQASVIDTRRFWRPFFSILPISTRPISAVRRTCVPPQGCRSICASPSAIRTRRTRP